MIIADTIAPCPSCGGHLVETPPEDDAAAWAYECPGCRWEAPAEPEPLTVARAEWTRWLWAEMEAERAAPRDPVPAGGDAWTWTEGGRTYTVEWEPHPDWPALYRLAYLVVSGDGDAPDERRLLGGIAERSAVEGREDLPDGCVAAWWLGVRSGVDTGPTVAVGWATVEDDAEAAVVQCAHALGFRGLVLVDGLEWAAEWSE